MVFTLDMENMFGKAHGGALFALIDEAFETASNSHGTVAVALNTNISYLASCQALVYRLDKVLSFLDQD